MTPRHLRQLLLVVMMALLGLGMVAVYSASAPAGESTYGQPLYFISHHLVAVVIGVLFSLGCLMIPYRFLRPSARWMLLTSIVLLVLVDLLGQEVGGARRWFRIGRWSMEPSEFAQLSLVLYLADVLARKGPAIREFTRGILPPLLVTGLLACLVLVQPDLGTAVVMGTVTMLLLMIAKARWQHLAGIAVMAMLILILLIAREGYRRQRLMVFLNPWQDPQGSGYQIVQSYIALASGGLVGRGLGGSLQKLFYLPSAHTDFIFAVLGEELGLLGSTAILGLFALLLTFGFRMATLTKDLFSKYLICGLISLLGLEAIVNIAVVTGLVPTKGLPLPLISYGGSSMIMNLIACALVFQASRHGEQPLSQSLAGI